MEVSIPKRTKIVNIILCIPGSHFSALYNQSFSKLLIYCMTNGINLDIQQMFSSNVYHTRECMVASTVMCQTKNIVAFGGKKYDYTLWIDSDQVFEPGQLEILLARFDADKALTVVGASIKVMTGQEYAFGWFDRKLIHERNELKRMTVAQMEGRQALIEVDYIGLAFTLVKFGVFEALEFPWFEGLPYSAVPETFDRYGMMGEDLSWCFRLKQKGYKFYADPLVQVGHEKSTVY